MTLYLPILLLVACSALFSGLTLGLMGLDVYDLKRKADLGNTQAKKVYPIRAKGNLLLTTLLLGNVAVNSALSIFLGSIATGIVAGIVSTALIFIFGEIIPQAVISRYALPFGAKTAGLMTVIIWIFSPIAWPIAFVLDKALGEEMQNVFSRQELIKVIEEHEDSALSDIDEDEERILRRVLHFSEKQVKDVMTPNTVVQTVAHDMVLTKTELERLVASGFSRFPVYKDKSDHIVGVCYLRDVIAKQDPKVQDIIRTVHIVRETDPLDEIFNVFLQKRQHLFVVNDEFGGFEGVITLEDVLEDIIGKEIVDEDDVVVDTRAQARKKVS